MRNRALIRWGSVAGAGGEMGDDGQGKTKDGEKRKGAER